MKQIDIAIRASEIGQEMKSVVLGIGHFILAALETEEREMLYDSIDENAIQNGYLRTYTEKSYDAKNVGRTNAQLTPFAKKFMDFITSEMKTHPKSFNKNIVKTLIDSQEYNEYVMNFYDWMDFKNFDSRERLNKKDLKVQDDFKDIDFVTNLNAKVEKQMPIIIGREKELEQVTAALLKKTKTNAVLVGEAGVGKTAIVEKLAYNIVTGNVHNSLKDKIILELNVANLLSGTYYRGTFEKKLKGLLDRVTNNPDVILFIDEFHNVMNAGANPEQGLGLSDILKPSLARGEIKVIGSTTYEEYRKFVEKDHAFERRFEKIDIEEPSNETTLEILKGLTNSFKNFHGVEIADEIPEEIISLCGKYLASRHFPDKAIDVLDAACVKVKMQERDIVTEEDIIKTVETMSNVKILHNDELSRYSLITIFENVLKGQSDAIEEVTDMLKLIDMGLTDSSKPMASMIFTGPTGVGKTELAKQIAKNYFGSEKRLIRIDMSEYATEADSTKIFGSAPGYVGYNESSQLLDGVKKQPYSVVLLDEVEKAHKKILNAFLQILDNGFATTSTGEKIDFRHTIIIMTSNLGFHNTDAKPISFGSEQQKTNTKVEKSLEDFFSPEFLNRIDKVIYFNKLNRNIIKEIAENYAMQFGDYELDDEDINLIYELADVEKNGARSIQKVVRTKILPAKIKTGAII